MSDDGMWGNNNNVWDAAAGYVIMQNLGYGRRNDCSGNQLSFDQQKELLEIKKKNDLEVARASRAASEIQPAVCQRNYAYCHTPYRYEKTLLLKQGSLGDFYDKYNAEGGRTKTFSGLDIAGMVLAVIMMGWGAIELLSFPLMIPIEAFFLFLFIAYSLFKLTIKGL